MKYSQKLILPLFLFCSHPVFSQRLLAFAKDTITEKWIVIDTSGNKITSATFDYPIRNNSALSSGKIKKEKNLIGYSEIAIFPFKKTLNAGVEKKWIYINLEGKQAIDGEFYWAFGFYDGVAVVRHDEFFFQYINRQGKTICPKTYFELKNFSEGYGIIESDKKHYFIDSTGKRLNSEGFDEANSFQNGKALVKQNNKYGIYNKNGEWQIPPEYDYIGNFSEDYFWFNKGKIKGFANIRNKILAETHYEQVRDFHNGMAAVMGKSGNDYYKWGYIDTTGVLKINYEFMEANDFSDGVAAVRKDLKWGVIDLTGKNIVPFQYDIIYQGLEGFIGLRKGRDIFLASTKTGELLPQVFEEIHNPTEGLRSVMINDKCGYIDSTGKLIVSAIYWRATPFKNGFARIKQNNLWGLIDKKGKIIIQPQYRNLEDFFYLKP